MGLVGFIGLLKRQFPVEIIYTNNYTWTGFERTQDITRLKQHETTIISIMKRIEVGSVFYGAGLKDRIKTDEGAGFGRLIIHMCKECINVEKRVVYK